jgi:hypothetical protein
MPQSVAQARLWLFVVILGIVFGAGIYEARVVVPLWASSPPASLHSPDSGRQFWAFVTTVPLTLVTIANAIAAWQSVAPQRPWWIAAVVLVVVERAATRMPMLPRSITMPPLRPMSVRAVGIGFAELHYEVPARP